MPELPAGDRQARDRRAGVRSFGTRTQPADGNRVDDGCRELSLRSKQFPGVTRTSLGPVDHSDPAEMKSGTDSTLNEDEALALLQRRDLSCEVIERITKSSAAMKSRKVQLAVAQHPKTPRHVSSAPAAASVHV